MLLALIQLILRVPGLLPSRSREAAAPGFVFSLPTEQVLAASAIASW